MRKSIVSAFVSVALLATAAVPALAAVNCDLVNRDLKKGKWPEDIALSMGITLSQVKSCQAKGGSSSYGDASRKSADPPKGSTKAINGTKTK